MSKSVVEVVWTVQESQWHWQSIWYTVLLSLRGHTASPHINAGLYNSWPVTTQAVPDIGFHQQLNSYSYISKTTRLPTHDTYEKEFRDFELWTDKRQKQQVVTDLAVMGVLWRTPHAPAGSVLTSLETMVYRAASHQECTQDSTCPVSYTHLTLPTKRIV